MWSIAEMTDMMLGVLAQEKKSVASLNISQKFSEK